MFELCSLQVWDQGVECVNIYHSAVGLFPEGSLHLQGIKQLLNRGNTLLLNTGETSGRHTQPDVQRVARHCNQGYNISTPWDLAKKHTQTYIGFFL